MVLPRRRDGNSRACDCCNLTHHFYIITWLAFVSALRGWVGEDKRHDWIHSNLHPATEVAQQLNANTKLKKKLLEDELIEPIKEWTIQLGDRVSTCLYCDFLKYELTHEPHAEIINSVNKICLSNHSEQPFCSAGTIFMT